MSINLDSLKQLSAFTTFANMAVSVNNENAVVCVGKQNGNVKEIYQNYNDKPYAFLRSRENKGFNNEVRALFRSTVASLFGGEDSIPDDVIKAMRLGDYDKGRPLTARRINEVKNAIVDYFNSCSLTDVPSGYVEESLNGETDKILHAADPSINSADDDVSDYEMKPEPKKKPEPKNISNVKTGITQNKDKIRKNVNQNVNIINDNVPNKNNKVTTFVDSSGNTSRKRKVIKPFES